MKKKIINGILMVALLAATATSFVSCKDNDEDVKTDLIAQLNKQAGDLTTAYKQADTDLENALRADLATKAELNNYATKQELKDSLANYAQKGWVDDELEKLWLALNDPDDPNSVDNRLNAIKDAIEGEGGINDQIADIQDDIEDLQEDIDKIIDALTNMVTSVTVNATSTNMLKNSKLFPGLNLQFLGAAFGQATTSFSFPSTEKDDFIDGHGVVLLM